MWSDNNIPVESFAGLMFQYGKPVWFGHRFLGCINVLSLLIEATNLEKTVVWNGTCGWHEKCGCGHSYIHIIENSIKDNTSCIID